MRGLPWWTTLTTPRNSLRLNPYLFSSTSLHPHPSHGTGRAVSGRAWARGGKWSPVARHPKFGIPVGGFLLRIVFLGVPRDVLILVSRSLLCSGSCPFSAQKHFFFNKSADCRFALDPATLHPKKKVCLKNRRIVARRIVARRFVARRMRRCGPAACRMYQRYFRSVLACFGRGKMQGRCHKNNFSKK